MDEANCLAAQAHRQCQWLLVKFQQDNFLKCIGNSLGCVGIQISHFLLPVAAMKGNFLTSEPPESGRRKSCFCWQITKNCAIWLSLNTVCSLNSACQPDGTQKNPNNRSCNKKWGSFFLKSANSITACPHSVPSKMNDKTSLIPQQSILRCHHQKSNLLAASSGCSLEAVVREVGCQTVNQLP